jgi:hypothetical protein
LAAGLFLHAAKRQLDGEVPAHLLPLSPGACVLLERRVHVLCPDATAPNPRFALQAATK